MRSLIVLLILTAFYSTMSIAQQKGDFSIETNIFRIAKDSYTHSPSSYSNNAQWFNGLSLGYNFNDRFRPYVSVLYSEGEISETLGRTGVNVAKEEIEFRVGSDYIINPNNKLVFNTGFQYFNRNANLLGVSYSDVISLPDEPIDREIFDNGFAFTGGVKYDISKRIYLYSKGRIGFGNFQMESGNGENSSYTYYKTKPRYEEPISAMGFAIVF